MLAFLKISKKTQEPNKVDEIVPKIQFKPFSKNLTSIKVESPKSNDALNQVLK